MFLMSNLCFFAKLSTNLQIDVQHEPNSPVSSFTNPYVTSPLHMEKTCLTALLSSSHTCPTSMFSGFR